MVAGGSRFSLQKSMVDGYLSACSTKGQMVENRGIQTGS